MRALLALLALFLATTSVVADSECQPVKRWRKDGPQWGWSYFGSEDNYEQWNLVHEGMPFVAQCVLLRNSHQIVIVDLFHKGRRDRKFEWRYPATTTCPLSCAGVAVPAGLLNR